MLTAWFIMILLGLLFGYLDESEKPYKIAFIVMSVIVAVFFIASFIAP